MDNSEQVRFLGLISRKQESRWITMMDVFQTISASLFLCAILFIVGWVFPFRLWIAARAAGINLRFFELVAMRLRRVPPSIIVDAMIAASQTGIKVTRPALEAHFLAGGDVRTVVMALISANKAGVALTYERATAIDLSGRNVYEVVRERVESGDTDKPI